MGFKKDTKGSFSAFLFIFSSFHSAEKTITNQSFCKVSKQLDGYLDVCFCNDGQKT